MCETEKDLTNGMQTLDNDLDELSCDISTSIKELIEKIKKTRDLPQKVEEFHSQFDEQSKLTTLDVTFALIGLGLRETASLLFKELKTKRLNDQEAAKQVHDKEKSNRGEKYYATLEEIASNPVPFDCIRKTPEALEDFNRNGVKLSGYNHRFTALGHDPLLGLIIGTANIMTNTITISTGLKGIHTYHVGTRLCNVDIPEKGVMDKIYERADTIEMFHHIIDRFKNDKNEGYSALGAALIKEFIHLISDVRTAQSLPIPILSAINPSLSHKLQYVGFDTLDLTSNIMEYYVARFIDYGILTIRDLWYRNFEKNNVVDEECFQARLKNIELFMAEGAVIGETAYLVCQIIKGDIQKALQGYSYGGVFESMKNIINDNVKLTQLRHEFVVRHSEEYIKNI